MLLIDGANARVTVDGGDPAAATDARRLAAMIIDGYGGRQG